LDLTRLHLLRKLFLVTLGDDMQRSIPKWAAGGEIDGEATGVD